jgi:TPR repeat protein
MALPFLQQWFKHRNTPVPDSTQAQADAGEADAQFLLGLKFASGQGVGQDYAQAAQWYAQAAEQDHCLAQFNLATMYGQGQGVIRDEAKATRWMTRAAELGDAGAQYKLGVQQHVACRGSQVGAVSESRIEALKWVQLSAAQGYRGAEGACEFVALDMTREEVAEGGRRVAAFAPSKRAGAPA